MINGQGTQCDHNGIPDQNKAHTKQPTKNFRQRIYIDC